MNIYMDPRNRILYASYYIKGLEEKYGTKNIHFSLRFFKDLDRSVSFSYDHYMAYVIEDDSRQFRVIIDYHDSVHIAEKAYKWCDVYAKINIENKDILKMYPKMISIPPGFGIRIWSVPKTVWKCFVNRYKCLSASSISRMKDFVYDYAVMATKRQPIEYYTKPESKKDGYVFHTSTLWINEDCQTKTNPIRASFIRACKKQISFIFEGGLVCKWDCPQEYKDILSPRYEMTEYLTKTKQSQFVFNTPAVLGCHGWKLGEYFAMGKAIITTPLTNVLPFDFKDGVNCFVVSNDQELNEAISKLVGNKDIVDKLEASSRYIFSNYCSPVKVINTIDCRFGL